MLAKVDPEEAEAGGQREARPPLEGLGEEVVPLQELERRYVLRVLDRFNGNRSRTAHALKIGTNTLWRKLKAWGEPPARRHVS